MKNNYILIVILIYICSLLICFGSCIKEDNSALERLKNVDSSNKKINLSSLYIEGFAKNANCEVRVNDIPLGIISTGKQMFYKSAERHLLPGENTVSIHPQNINGIAAIRIAIYQQGEWVDGKGGKELGEIQTDKGKVAEIKITLDNDRPVWLWTTADDITSAVAQQEARDFIKKAYQLLVSGDAENFIPLLTPYYKDLEKYNPSFKFQTQIEDSKVKLEGHYEKKDAIWKFTNYNEMEIVLVPVANGKLLDVRRIDGSPVFRTYQDNKIDRITYFNIIGKQNGKWEFYY
jgi:hypothetical protein